MNHYQQFLKLHQGQSPFLIGNIWDVKSAEIFNAAGYKAIGSSSHAIAGASGYPDGEQVSFETILQVAKRVTKIISIPFTVDMEAGYSRTAEGIQTNIEKLHDAGVIGINLEDSLPAAKRKLMDAKSFAGTVTAIADHISKKNMGIFFNIRTDAFLLGMPDALEETLPRVKLYEEAGAAGIFVPGIIQQQDISAIVQSTHLPINVMCMPGLPDFDVLAKLGVKRISMGGFFYNKVYQHVRQLSEAILNGDNFSSII
jgi:2-methylisocitrate lyase-like PEP mutase family enzyme